MDTPIVVIIVALFGLMSVAILWLALTSPAPTTDHAITRRLRSLLIHLMLLIFPSMLNGFAYLPLFTDHKPFPQPFTNLRVLAGLEFVALGLLYVFVLHLMQRLYRKWSFSSRRQQWLVGLLGVVFVATMIPVGLVILVGP